MGTTTGAQLLVRKLELMGVKDIFGIPGDVTYFFEAISKSSIRFFTVRHEQAGGFMADVYGRLADRPGVCYGSLGPGATNLTTSVANAYQDRSPVVVLLDQVKTKDFHQNYHQFIDLEHLFAPITKEVLIVKKAEDIPLLVERAFETAVKEKAGPVALILPEDILGAPVPEEMVKALPVHKKIEPYLGVSREQLNALYEEFSKSRFCICLVGEEVVRGKAHQELLRFIEAYNLPVLTTFMAKGAISEKHPLSLGTISRHFKPILEHVFKDADLILCIGYDYIEGIKPEIWEVGRKKRVVNVDSTVNFIPEFYKPDLEIVTNIRAFLAEMANLANGKQQIPIRMDALREEKNNLFKKKSPETERICAILEVVRGSIAEDDILISDVGLHKQFVGLGFQAYREKTVLFTNGLSAMGFALPGAMGAKTVFPEKNIVVVCGDGGFLMNIQDLITSKQEKLPVIVILFVDGHYGLIRWKQRQMFGSDCGVTITNPDFELLARSFGASYSAAQTPDEFKKSFEQALKSTCSSIIAVPVNYDTV